MLSEADRQKLYEQLGVANLPPQMQEQVAQSAMQSLEIRVQRRIEADLTSKQMKEVYKLGKKGDEAAVAAWYQTNYPQFADVVGEEMQALLTEVDKGVGRTMDMLKEGENQGQ